MKLFSFSFRIYATAALHIDPAARRAQMQDLEEHLHMLPK
jgi:hypothetical protein